MVRNPNKKELRAEKCESEILWKRYAIEIEAGENLIPSVLGLGMILRIFFFSIFMLPENISLGLQRYCY